MEDLLTLEGSCWPVDLAGRDRRLLILCGGSGGGFFSERCRAYRQKISARVQDSLPAAHSTVAALSRRLTLFRWPGVAIISRIGVPPGRAARTSASPASPIGCKPGGQRRRDQHPGCRPDRGFGIAWFSARPDTKPAAEARFIPIYCPGGPHPSGRDRRCLRGVTGPPRADRAHALRFRFRLALRSGGGSGRDRRWLRRGRTGRLPRASRSPCCGVAPAKIRSPATCSAMILRGCFRQHLVLGA